MSNEKLAVIVLGKRNSGKSKTWYELFRKRRLKTSNTPRNLYIEENKYMEVFLVSGSPEEYKKYVGEIITDVNVRIVLCSVQYSKKAKKTIDFFHDKGFDLYVHWLNPGYRCAKEYNDDLEIISYLNNLNAIVKKRDGKVDVSQRVKEIRTVLTEWAIDHHLLMKKS